MASVLLEVDPLDPQPWLVARVVEVLRKGGVAVLPTDTVYGLACAITHPEAIERIYALKDLDPKKPLSILVRDLRMVSRYARGVTTPVYRLLKRVLPGPYTFIFRATDEVPKIMLRRRKTIGIRIPDTPIVMTVLDGLEEPILTTSILTPEDQFLNDPIEIERVVGRWVDLVVDGGVMVPNPSTVVDLSGDEPVLVREGKGDLAPLELFE